MNIIPYARQFIDNKDINSVSDCLKSDYLTQGPQVERFEKIIASYCGAKYAVAVNSGTSALHIACLAAGLQKGDEAITSPITFAASSNCILYCGAKPVFADVQEDTINIDPIEIEKAINKKTKALIPVHFAGYPCDLEKIYKIARKYKLLIIEDAAHALGAKYKGNMIGGCKYSDMAILSFHAVKHITTGEGGMVLTNNKKLYEKLALLRSHGITKSRKSLRRNQGGWYYEMQCLGFNYRLTDIQCSLGISQFKKIDYFLKRRREIVDRYNEAFSKFEELKLLEQNKSSKSSHHLYVLRFALNRFSVSKRRIFDEYRKLGILVNVHYIPVYSHPYYKNLGYKNGICPKAENYYREAITIPLFPKMTNSEIKRTIDVTRIIIKKLKK
ncbi:MAG: UDP-4-amino-4,6-dideoxy-N-acetyl-beta-L-altrosamine transaminase [Candidatus Omnitrophica bacterium]|nr:UDP-4-amino-4,6-dideoxy-N-acetyl-beta-L-altrosamine transaminase [Candidatus Omnitrophota bacterium]